MTLTPELVRTLLTRGGKGLEADPCRGVEVEYRRLTLVGLSAPQTPEKLMLVRLSELLLCTLDTRLETLLARVKRLFTLVAIEVVRCIDCCFW